MAIGIAVDEYRQGRSAVAGWVLAGGTAVPGALFFGDLWRNDVPGPNYLIAAAFTTAAVIGLALIVRSLRHPARQVT